MGGDAPDVGRPALLCPGRHGQRLRPARARRLLDDPAVGLRVLVVAGGGRRRALAGIREENHWTSLMRPTWPVHRTPGGASISGSERRRVDRVAPGDVPALVAGREPSLALGRRSVSP